MTITSQQPTDALRSVEKTKRCEACRKKVGIMGQTCKCGKQLCISHLQAEMHQCTYDFRSECRKQLEKEQMVGPLSD